jgi:hypothetical protein
MSNFEERLDLFRKELKDLCKKYQVVLDAAPSVPSTSWGIEPYIIVRDGKRRLEWQRLDR